LIHLLEQEMALLLSANTIGTSGTSGPQPASTTADQTSPSTPKPSVPGVTFPVTPTLSTPTSINPYGCYENINNSVVLMGGSQPITLPGADVETFVDLSQFDLCFGKDKNNVYHDEKILPWADIRAKDPEVNAGGSSTLELR
jgi:hypothetical protein